MKTLGRNSDNDIYLEANGKIAVLEGADAQCAIIESVLLTQKGELQFDEEAGIDYFGTVLLSPQNIDFWASDVKTKIEELDFVSSVEDFTYEFDGKTSTLNWSMTVINNDDERLDLKDRKTVFDTRPGIDLKFDNIYDLPENTDGLIDIVSNMTEAVSGLSEFLPGDSLKKVKEVINSAILSPGDPAMENERTITFSFSRIPVGTIIDLKNFILEMEERPVAESSTLQPTTYYPVSVKFSDGTTVMTRPSGEGKVEMYFDGTEVGTAHTITSKSSFSMTIKGRVKRILTREGSELPIFLNAKGAPFVYLSSVQIGSLVNLVEIGDYAFYGFGNLREVIWNEKNDESKVFGESAFQGCQSLIGLKWLPKKLTAIGKNCFRKCTTLTSLEGLEKTSVSELPEGCFAECSGLVNASYLPQVITALPDFAFEDCVSIETLDDMPDGIKSFGKGCFYGCNSITDILYPPEQLETIGESAFEGCSSLKSLYLSENVESIGKRAFANCSVLDNIFSDASGRPEIQTDTFSGASQDLTVYVSRERYDAFIDDDLWNRIEIKKYGTFKFQLSNVSEGLTILGSTGVLSSNSIWTIAYSSGHSKMLRFTNDTTQLPAHTYDAEDLAGLSGDPCVEIRGYVKSIAATSSASYPFLASREGGEFAYLSELRTIDSTIESIGDYTFAKSTNLNYIESTDRQSEGFCIGEYAFSGCSSLTSLGWLKNGVGLAKDAAGDYLPALGVGCFKDSGVTSLVFNKDHTLIENRIVEYPAYCFAGTKIINLEGIGGTEVTALGEHCFEGCGNLKAIVELNATGIEHLPDYCFANCTALESIAGIEKIRSTRITIIDPDGDGVYTQVRETILGKHLFENCTSLSDIEPLENAYTVPPPDFDENSDHESFGIEDLSDYMFAGCSSVKSLAGLTERIHSLGEHCFEGCSGLSFERDGSGEVVPMTYPLMDLASTSVTALPNYCFANCAGIQNLIGLRKIKTIGDYCFSGCSKLVSTSGLGYDLSQIGYSAFYGCMLSNFTCIATVPPSATSTSFRGIDIQKVPLYVREDTIQAYKTAAGWSSFIDVEFRNIKITLTGISKITNDDANSAFITAKIHDGFNSYIPGIYYVDYGDGTRHSFIGDQSVSIEPHEFRNEEGIIEDGTYVLTIYGDVLEFGAPEQRAGSDINGHYLPSDIEGTSPFLGTAATTISDIAIENSFLEKIYPFSFCGCTGIDTVKLNLSDMAEIGACAFAGCTMLYSVSSLNAKTIGDCAFMRCSSLPEIDSFSSVQTIGNYCFSGDIILERITGLSGCENIGKYAFGADPDYGLEGCTKLASTAGLGSAKEIGSYAFNGCSSLTTVSGFGSNIAQIDDYAFKGCPVTLIMIPTAAPPYLVESAFTEAVYGNQDVEVYVPYEAVEVYKTEKPVVAGSSVWDGTSVNYWSRFGDRIKTRNIRFHLSDIQKGERFFGSNGYVSANGSWAISFGDGESSSSFVGASALPDYTFKTAGEKDIYISGAITGLSRVSDSGTTPIFYTKTTGIGATRYPITEIEGTSALELTSLGSGVFRGCSSLEKVINLPSVTSIGDNCFNGCESLSDVSGFVNVTTIGSNAFTQCNSLEDLFGLSSVSTIGSYAFSGCSSLKKIDGLGTGVTSIGEYAFVNCPLEEVQILSTTPPTAPNTAFSTINKTSVPLYVLSRSIDSYAGWCGWETATSRTVLFTLKSVPTGTVMEGIGGWIESDTFVAVDFAYSSQGDATPVIVGLPVGGEFPSNLLDINNADFYVRIEGDVTSISGNEDAGTPFFTTTYRNEKKQYLTDIETVGASKLKAVGTYSFKDCTKLSRISLPTVETIGTHAFQGCTAITELIGLPSVKNFADFSFYGCSGITELSGLGANVEYIGSNSFGAVGGIDFIQIRAKTPPELKEDAFGNLITIDADPQPHYVPKTYVYVPATSVIAYSNTDPWSYFRYLDGSTFKNSIYSRSISFTLTNVPAGTEFNKRTANPANVVSTGSWTIDWGDGNIDTMSESVQTIPPHTYEDAGSYTVTIDGDISEIGGYGDYSTAGFDNILPILWDSGMNLGYLTEVSCAGQLAITTIGQSCFANCGGLTRVTGFGLVETIGNAAFYNCQSLVTLGNFPVLTTIGDYGFAECSSLSYMACFPAVVSLGAYAFYNDSSIKSISYLGKESGKTAGLDGRITARFGEFCFVGCNILSIDSEYVVPPIISPTTFSPTGSPNKDTVVYVPSGSLEDYEAAPVWREYLIREKCYISFQMSGIAAGDTISTGTFYATGPVVVYWGDDTIDTYSASDDYNPAHSFTASHTYSQNLGQFKVQFRGDFTKFTADSDNAIIQVGSDKTRLNVVEINNVKSLKEIGSGAFNGCTELLSAYITSDVEANTLEKIGANAFNGCSKLYGVCLDETRNPDVYGCCYIPSSVYSIGDYAFCGCSSIEVLDWSEVTVPTGNTAYVGSYCFSECSNLTTVNTFGGYTTIPDHCFFRCINLSGITADGKVLGNVNVSSLGDYCFAGCKNIGEVNIPSSVTSIGVGCFSCVPYLDADDPYEQHLDLHNRAWLSNNMKSEEDRAMLIGTENVGITSFSWASSGTAIRSIGMAAFAGCTKMTVYGNFPTHLQANDIVGTSVVTTDRAIPSFTFLNCRKITSFEFLSNDQTHGIQHVGMFAYSYSGLGDLTKARFASADTFIEEGLFMGCSSISSMAGLPSGTTALKSYSFAMCPTITAISADNCTEIGIGCFAGCTGITDLIGLPKVTVYPTNAFLDCTGLTKISRFSDPSDTSITSITLDNESFGGCTNIRRIDLQYQFVVSTDGDPFPDLMPKSNVEIMVPDRLYTDYKSDTYWMQYDITTESIINKLSLKVKTIVPTGGGTLYGHGILYFKNSTPGYIDWGDGTRTDLIPETDNSVSLENINKEYVAEEYLSDTEITIAIYGEITSISGGIMDDGTVMRINPIFSSTTTYTEGSIESKSISYAPNSWITEITYFGNELTTINNGCFSSCSSLRAVTRLPDNLTTIGRYSFLNCFALPNLNFFKNSQLSSIGDGCFYDCSSLTDLTGLASCVNLTEIPSNCFDSRIGISVLNGDGGTKLDCIPPNVILIGHYAFHNRQFSGFVSTNTKTISLGSGAFRGNKLLTDLSGLTFDLSSNFVFADCLGLESLTGLSIINSSIPRLTFYNCQKLKLDSTSTIPSQITRIGGGAFARCVSISSLEGLSRITNLEDSYSGFGVFESTSISSLSSLPNSIQIIGSRAFAGCPITNMVGLLELPSCTTIGDYAFYGCGNQQDSYASFDLVLPPNLQSLGKYCFANSKVKFLYPETSPEYSYVNSMGEGCFKDCLKITDISGLYNFIQLQELPKDCFKGCRNLEYFGSLSDDYGGIPESVQVIKGGCFQGCPNIQYIVLRRYNPSDREYRVTTIEDTDNPAFDYSALRSIARIEVPGGSKNDVDGYLSSSSGWIDGDTKFVDDMFYGYYILSFNPNGGNVDPSSIGIEEGTMIGIGTLPTPTRDGYSFIGWYTQQTDGDEVNSETVVTESMTIYAHWNPV